MTEPPERTDPGGSTDPIEQPAQGTTDPVPGARATKVVNDSDSAVFDQLAQMLHHAKRVTAERGAEPPAEPHDLAPRDDGLVASETQDAARAELSARVPAGADHKTFEVAKVKGPGVQPAAQALAKPSDSRPLAIDPHLAAAVRLSPSDPDEARARGAKTDVVPKRGAAWAALGAARAADVDKAALPSALAPRDDPSRDPRRDPSDDGDGVETPRPAGLPQSRHGWTVALAAAALVLIVAIALFATGGSTDSETAEGVHVPAGPHEDIDEDEVMEDDGAITPSSQTAVPTPSGRPLATPGPGPRPRPPPEATSAAPPTPSVPSAEPSAKGLIVPPRD